ncbi:hypothetical protein BKI52_09520 [marine bacterium AO1-C]|nr:hypothetical protein BKI52_09520 [marine bacterium AO1-C]
MPSRSSLENKSNALWKKYLSQTHISPEAPSNFSNKFWDNYRVLLEKSKDELANAPQKPSNEALIRDKYQVYWEYNDTTLNGEIQLPRSHKLFNTYAVVAIFALIIYLSVPENSFIAEMAYKLLFFGSIVIFASSFLIKFSPRKALCTIELHENHFLYQLKIKSEEVKIQVPYHQIKKFKAQGEHLKIFVKDQQALTYSPSQKQKQAILIPMDIENTFHLRRFFDDITQINRSNH